MFWLKFSLIAVIVFVFISIIKFLLRKIFKVEKVRRKFFSYYHINDSHRKIDIWVRTLTAITLLILTILMINYEGLTHFYIIGCTSLLTLDYAVRAFFELKYSEYPKQAIFTLAEMFLTLTAIVIVFQFWVV